MMCSTAPKLAALALAFALGTVSTARAASGDSDQDGIPDKAEALLLTDPLVADTDGDGLDDKADSEPLKLSKPVVMEGKAAGLKIVAGKVEDNFDPKTKKDVADHIEIVVANKGSNDLQGIGIVIAIKDDGTGASETYYRDLTGVSIPKGKERTLHFDSKGSPDPAASTDHFHANPNSTLYKTSNAKSVEVTVFSSGYQPAILALKKDAGDAEQPD